jgi:hypothetical protein
MPLGWPVHSRRRPEKHSGIVRLGHTVPAKHSESWERHSQRAGESVNDGPGAYRVLLALIR